MIQKNRIKYNIKDKKDNEIANRRRKNFKNVYTQIKRNIKTSFSQTKQKKKLNIATSKKLTENINKKSENNNIYFSNNKKFEDSRNDNKAKLDNKNLDEIDDGENDIFFNKTEKDIKLLYNKNSSKNSVKANKDNKIRDNERDLFNKRSNLYSNNVNIDIKEDKKNFIHNNFLFQTKKINSNKEMKPLNMTNKNKSSENNETKKKENSFEKIPKLIINKKLITKEDFMKSKNLFNKLNSARFANIENHKLNLNFNKDIKSEIKTISNKNTSRITSQKLSDLKEKELNLDKIKKIKKNKIFKQIKNFGKKNHSMTMNDTNKILLLNDTIKNEKEKDKKKYSVINFYNYPNVRKNIPHHKNFIIDSAEKENSENENNIKNDLSNLNNTCFNFNDMNMNNSTLNNNLNGTFNQKETKKKTPNKYHYHNNSFNNLYNKENFYSKPVARLKKRIFDSSSDKKNDNSISDKNENNSLNKNDYQEKDSLEINRKEINNNIIKELLITIKTLNQIINTQKKIIEEQMIKLKTMNYEIEEKEKETKNYKQICLKLMFYLKEEKELNILNEKNQRRNIIENQIIKENKILKELIKLPIINIKVYNNDNNILENEKDIKRNSFYKINENGSTINFYKMSEKIDVEKGIENGNNMLDPFYNLEIISHVNLNKKRETSCENRKKIKEKNK